MSKTDKMESPPISDHDRRLAYLYEQLIERYMKPPSEIGISRMAVRLLAMRYGFDSILHALVLKGAPWVAERARREIAYRQEFIVRMMADYPPDDPREVENAIKEGADDLTALESEAGQKCLTGLLERLQKRERMPAIACSALRPGRRRPPCSIGSIAAA